MGVADDVRNLLIVSDLHLSEGLDPVSGKFSANEDFFFDDEFARFLEYHARLADEEPRYGGRRWKLLLNGDIFCFLQVTAKPRHAIYGFEGGLDVAIDLFAAGGQRGEVVVDEEPQADLSPYARLHARLWAPAEARGVSAALRLAQTNSHDALTGRPHTLLPGQWNEITLVLGGIDRDALRQGRRLELLLRGPESFRGTLRVQEIWADPVLSPREERYGLGTQPEQTAWKLCVIATGHPAFFQALARFVAQGHQIVYIKGNHDVDMHWPLAQQTFRDLVVEAAEECPDVTADEAQLCAAIEFCPWIYVEPGLLYAEHGNQYEPANFFTDFLNPVLPGDPQRLALPLGSFFVRYVFNALEGIHPWADNVKPSTDYIKWAFRQDLFNTLGIVVDNMGLVVHAMWQAFRKRAVVPNVNWAVLEDVDEGHTARTLSVAAPQQIAAIREIAALSLRRVSRWWQQVLWRGLWAGFSFLTLLAVAALLLTPVLRFVRLGGAGMLWWPALAQVGAAAALFVLRRFGQRRLATGAEPYYLRDVSAQIAAILERHGAPVPYLVFGHTHNADIARLPGPPGRSCDQWYVNTGTWVQVFSDEERLIRDRKQFSYFEVVPGETPSGCRLWQWNDDAGRPAPVLMLTR